MSLAPISATAAALRVQVIGAVETDLLASLATAIDATPAALPSRPAPTADPARQAVDVARAQAAGRQAGLAPLFADLEQAQASPQLPGNVKTAISQILALRLPLDGPVTAETVQQAIAQSGLFLEPHLAQASGRADPAPPDLKRALLVLQQALAAVPTAEPVQKSSPPATPPPVRDAALSAQAPAPPTLSASDTAPVIAQHLLRDLDGAVARQVLHQLASLPDGSSSAWMFELPVATPQGTALAQFEIDRDGAWAGSDAEAAAWRVRFSIDIAPLGPVHVHLGLSGERAGVTLWAEDAEGLARLRNQAEALTRALPGDVVVHPGAPRRPIPASGRFVDQST